MRLAIELLWWLGILGALGLTAVILKEVLLVVRALRQIVQLVDRIEIAARGIGVHATGAAALSGISELLRVVDGRVGEAATRLDSLADTWSRGAGDTEASGARTS